MLYMVEGKLGLSNLLTMYTRHHLCNHFRNYSLHNKCTQLNGQLLADMVNMSLARTPYISETHPASKYCNSLLGSCVWRQQKAHQKIFII